MGKGKRPAPVSKRFWISTPCFSHFIQYEQVSTIKLTNLVASQALNQLYTVLRLGVKLSMGWVIAKPLTFVKLKVACWSTLLLSFWLSPSQWMVSDASSRNDYILCPLQSSVSSVHPRNRDALMFLALESCSNAFVLSES